MYALYNNINTLFYQLRIFDPSLVLPLVVRHKGLNPLVYMCPSSTYNTFVRLSGSSNPSEGLLVLNDGNYYDGALGEEESSLQLLYDFFLA